MLSKEILSALGAALYVGEGTKLRRIPNGRLIYSIEFTNKDPKTVVVFLQFLRKIIKPVEERIKAQIFIYPDHNKTELIRFWSKITKIPIHRFTKPILLRQKNKKYIPNPLGTMKIRYHHKEHFLQLQGIIDKYFK